MRFFKSLVHKLVPGRLVVVGLAACVAGVLIAASPAYAAGSNGALMGVTITSTVKSTTPAGSGEPPGYCTWTVASDVTVYNESSTDTLHYTSIYEIVTWSGASPPTPPGDDSGTVSSTSSPSGVTVTSAGSPPLQSGDTLSPGEIQHYNGFTVSFDMPCNASTGDLSVGIQDQYGTGSGDNYFLQNGTPLALDVAGGLGFIALVGLALGVTMKRWRKPAAPAE